MFKNYFKIAWRNLIKDKQFSLINLLGLSTGLACALLIYLWVSDELSIDKFNENDSQLYQVMKTAPSGDGEIETSSQTPGLLAQSMQNEFPEVQYASAVNADPEHAAGILSINDKHLKANSGFVDKNFFQIFSYPLIEGSTNTFVSTRYNVLISDKLALKLFNSTKNIVGKTVTWDNGAAPGSYGKSFAGSYIISGIFQSPPANATSRFDLFFNYDLFAAKNSDDLLNWYSNNEYTYLLLKKGTDITAFNKKIKDFTKEKIRKLYPDDKDALRWEGDIFVQKYSDRYLHNNYINGAISGGRIEYVKLFSIIAVFILIIASINFMNLSTAKASRRMKEVGIKKVVGASRSSLIRQYIGESIIMAFVSLLIALFTARLLLPVFREITGKDISLQVNANLIIAAILITLITGFVAGSYPALYLSRFKPVTILKGTFIASAGESRLRKVLVVLQFTISVILIISVLVVYGQVQLIQTKALGYNKDNIIRFSNEGALKQNLTAFLTQIKNIPGVKDASDVDGDMFGNHSGGSGIDWQGKRGSVEFDGLYVDYDFMETMGLEMKEGRMFSAKFGADSTGIVFNETAIVAMGLINPIGKTVSLYGEEKHVIGVVKDFNFESLHKKIQPFFFSFRPNGMNIVVKIKAGSERASLEQIEKVYHQYNSGLLFEYTFLDDDFNVLYASEQRVAALSKYFAGIAIIISCLGLFGLAAFTAQKRKKEIGIRKIIGASVTNITAMLSKDFLILIGISLLVAFPVSWWLMNNWLQGFAYRINISPWLFFMAGLSVVLITLFTISFQSVKAAMANPVESLRTE